MKTILLSVFICFISVFGFVHETNEAFFKFVQKQNTIEIEAEFPWTMRNALIAFNPSLENSTNKNAFENSFIEYIKANLILKDKNGDTLEYQAFQKLENNGHSHQNYYRVIFKGNDLFEITNTMMFNLNDNQINYNRITINSTEKIIQTKMGLSHIQLKD